MCRAGLNALLSAEDAVGVELDEQAVGKHRRAALFSYSGPVALPLSRREPEGSPATFTAHDVREGFHALYALITHRADEEAKQLAENSIAAIGDLWNLARGWDLPRLKRDYGLSLADENENFTRTLPRAIGPLVKLYRSTGSEPALELAVELKEKLLRDHFRPDGEYDIGMQGNHVHSIACDLSSLAQLAEATNDSELFDRVIGFYDRGMWELRDVLGWAPAKTGAVRERQPDRGEVNTTGDLVETALILGRRGLPHYFEDAERMLRCHLLPSQLRDTGFMVEPDNPQAVDGRRDVAGRLRGAFGFPAPYGHEPVELKGNSVDFHLDIVGGAVGSLCEAHRWTTRFDEDGHHVDLLFTHETDAIRVESIYTHEALTVSLKRPGALRIRIPSWAEHDGIRVEGIGESAHYHGSYLSVASQPVGRPVRLHYELPARDLVLQHQTRDIHVRLRGDRVEAMDNFGADLTFFDPF